MVLLSSQISNMVQFTKSQYEVCRSAGDFTWFHTALLESCPERIIPPLTPPVSLDGEYHTLTHSLTHTLTYSLTHSHTLSLTLLTHSLYSLTHSTHSLLSYSVRVPAVPLSCQQSSYLAIPSSRCHISHCIT